MKLGVMVFLYHPDHLGSSSFITGATGEPTQHLEYLPFGELFIEERSTWNTPYKFSAKELDDETGYSYFGARYYDPNISIWLSVDPLSDKYPGYSPYNYALNNPLKFIDPDGRGSKTTIKNEDGQNTVIVQATIYVYQAKGDDINLGDFANTLEESLNRQFNPGGLTMRAINPNSGKKERMPVRFEFNVQVLDGSPTDIAPSVVGNTDISNNYFLVHNDGGGTDMHAYGGNSGMLQTNTSENRWAHERIHGLGYTPSGGGLGDHSADQSSLMHHSPSSGATVTQGIVNRMNQGRPATQGRYGGAVGFGAGMRNYIYNNRSTGRDPIINNYAPSKKFTWY